MSQLKSGGDKFYSKNYGKNNLKSEKLNLNSYVWVRSCEQEIEETLLGVVTGKIPPWLNGTLLRNGPGKFNFGNDNFNHYFDGAALLQRFHIVNGKVTYQCKFLKSESYKTNSSANRIVVNEFATVAARSPNQNFFSRFLNLFHHKESDNAPVSIYPFNEEFFIVAEVPYLHKIDPETIDTIARFDLRKKFKILYHSSHPHVMANGTVYNLALALSSWFQPVYIIVCYPKGENVFDDAKIVAKVPVSWKFYPSYMHSFGITENFFVIVEHPLTLSVKSIIKAKLTNAPIASCFKAFYNKNTKILLVDRKSGKLTKTFEAETFFAFHLINQYEKDNHVVIDICCFEQHNFMDYLYVDRIKNDQVDPFEALEKAKALRFVLPLENPDKKNEKQENKVKNLVKLENSSATAFLLNNGSILCKPEALSDFGCELPRINYEKYLGRDYRFFYAVSASKRVSNGSSLVKIDVQQKTTLRWFESDCHVSEPIFVASPHSESEDDGVILASILWNNEENRVGLLVLDAKTMNEIGRCEFKDLPSPIPKCLHGWFAGGKMMEELK